MHTVTYIQLAESPSYGRLVKVMRVREIILSSHVHLFPILMTHLCFQIQVL
jgi:hypothetical protein